MNGHWNVGKTSTLGTGTGFKVSKVVEKSRYWWCQLSILLFVLLLPILRHSENQMVHVCPTDIRGKSTQILF